jgi:uncharacterized membrane protein
MDRFTLLSLTDVAAAGVLIVCWAFIGFLIEHPPKSRPSVSHLMVQQRLDWMKEFITRDPRIFDSQILTTLLQSTSFFASTCLLAVGGVLALVGNPEPLEVVTSDLTLIDANHAFFQIKLLVVALFLTNAFLRFVWANRVFGYCAVAMAAVPNDPNHPDANARALVAAHLNIRAAFNFNRGLRSMYFALAVLAWLLGPVALVLSTLVTTYILWSREFASLPRKIILGETSS